MTYDEFLKAVLIAKLKKTKHDVGETAKLMNMPKGTVMRYIKQFGISLPVRKKTQGLLAYWSLIAGHDRECYLKVMSAITACADPQHETEFKELLQKKVRHLTAEFTSKFCESDGAINWAKLVKYNAAVNKDDYKDEDYELAWEDIIEPKHEEKKVSYFEFEEW